MHRSAPDTNASLARVITHAIETADKPKHQIASEAGIHRETMLKVMRGERAISIDRAVRLLEVCGVSPHAIIVLTLAGEEALACEWMRREMGAFLDEFITSLPGQLDRTLGRRVEDLDLRFLDRLGGGQTDAELVEEIYVKHVMSPFHPRHVRN